MPSEVNRMERRVARWRRRDANRTAELCLKEFVTGLSIPLCSDWDRNGVDDIEDDALGLLETLGSHTLRSAQHHAMG